MACINPIVFRLPPNLKDKYNLPEYQGIFGSDNISDRLVLKVLPEDYNAANPINKETKLGFAVPYSIITRNLYQFEAVDKREFDENINMESSNERIRLLANEGISVSTPVELTLDKDRRGAVHRYVLRDMLKGGGNLSVYGFTANTTTDCDEPLVAVEDYHELDEYEDEQQGFTLRVGVLTVESLKGSYREKGTNCNYNRGCRVIFTHTHKIVNGQLVVYVPQV